MAALLLSSDTRKSYQSVNSFHQFDFSSPVLTFVKTIFFLPQYFHVLTYKNRMHIANGSPPLYINAFGGFSVRILPYCGGLWLFVLAQLSDLFSSRSRYVIVSALEILNVAPTTASVGILMRFLPPLLFYFHFLLLSYTFPET